MHHGSDFNRGVQQGLRVRVTGYVAIAIVAVTIAVTGCNRTPAAPARITQFRVTPAFIPKGISGKLCYGVENATKIELNPPVEDLRPSLERCIDISPAQATTYS